MSRSNKIRWPAPWEGKTNDPDVELSGYAVIIMKYSKEKETNDKKDKTS
ncbi:MAG: hypothetical protein IIC15_05865 [Thaumarchaeota archaeon]|nr:hypothetical protein [Nitrososphaerota archaeon]